jgi:hypothetical protein
MIITTRSKRAESSNNLGILSKNSFLLVLSDDGIIKIILQTYASSLSYSNFG